MKKKWTLKRILAGVLVVVLGFGAYGAFYIYTLVVESNTLRPCTAEMGKHRNEDTNSLLLPCYEQAVKNVPGSQHAQYELAGALASAGRYEEARPIYERLSHSFGPYSSDARKMLLPGSMQYYKEMNDRLQHNWQAQQALTAEEEATEKEFLRLHATVRGGRIIRMSPEDRVVWKEMRDRYQKQQNALIGYGKQ